MYLKKISFILLLTMFFTTSQSETQKTSETEHEYNFYVGTFDIIDKDLISIFTKNNIRPIDCLNKKLDPNLHQAMMEIDDDQKEPGTIIQEVQKGFMIKDRLLRP